MSDAGYERIKNLYEDILDINDEELESIEFKHELFSEYVEKVYKEVSKRYSITRERIANVENDEGNEEHIRIEKYKIFITIEEVLKLIDIPKTDFKNLMLEVIFSNLYEYLTLMLQTLNCKGIRHESYLYSLNGKHRERLKKRLQEKRLTPKGIKSFKKVCELETIPIIKYYIPHFMKAYKDVLFVPRGDTKIIDISPYYSDIFTALMYESEEDFNNKEYMEDKELIKSYQMWNFSKSTISHIANMYRMIIDSANESGSDKFVQLLFMEKLFGLINISAILKKECSPKEYINFTGAISGMESLGYSNLHRIIIEKISADNSDVYSEVYWKYIYPICIKCLCTCIRKAVYYIGRLNTEKRKEAIGKFQSSCQKQIRNSPLMSVQVSYDVVKMTDRIKKYRIKNLDDNISVELMKNLKYKSEDMCSGDEVKECVEALRRDYTLDYVLTSDYEQIFDCGFVDLTLYEYYEGNEEDENGPWEAEFYPEIEIDKKTGRIDW